MVYHMQKFVQTTGATPAKNTANTAGALRNALTASNYMTHPTPLPTWCECRV